MKLIADALKDVFISPNESDQNLEAANVVDGLFFIGRAILTLSRSIDKLGNGNAATEMGAIENLSKEIHDGLSSIASAIADHEP